jgi:hypothetical protein
MDSCGAWASSMGASRSEVRLAPHIINAGCGSRDLSYDNRMGIETTEDASLWGGYAARKLSHHEARMEQLIYWSRQSVAARLQAATALTRRMVEMRGMSYDEQQADFTVSRVRRRRG